MTCGCTVAKLPVAMQVWDSAKCTKTKTQAVLMKRLWINVDKTCGLTQVLGVFGGGSSFSFLASLPSLSFFSSASFISTSFSPSFLPLVSSGMALLGVLATQSNLHLSLQATTHPFYLKSTVIVGYKRYFLTWTWCRFKIVWSPLERERQGSETRTHHTEGIVQPKLILQNIISHSHLTA